MQEEKRFVGIDLGKRTYEMAIITPKGVIRSNGLTTVSGRAKLYSKLKKTDVVALETTGLAFVIEREIRKVVGCDVYILHAGKLRIIYDSTRKTDKEDALKLARLVEVYKKENLPVVAPPSDQEWERRKMLSEYKILKSDRTKELNRLHAIFEKCGITDIKKSDLATGKRRNECVRQLEGIESLQAKRLIERLNLIEEQIKEVNKMIEEEIQGDENIKLLLTVPGVGKLTSLAFMAYVGDTSRFEKAAQVSNYIGLVPKVDISCSIVRYGNITKKGNGYLRSLLTQAAWSIVRSNQGGALRTKYIYMTVEKGKSKKKSITAISRKMAELMYTVIKNQQAYNPLYYKPFDINKVVHKNGGLGAC